MEIDEKTFEILVRDQQRLHCLQSYGVDNWDGYSDAMEDYYKWEQEREQLQKLKPLIQKYYDSIVEEVTTKCTVESLDRYTQYAVYDKDGLENILTDFVEEILKIGKENDDRD